MCEVENVDSGDFVNMLACRFEEICSDGTMCVCMLLSTGQVDMC